VVRHGDDSRGDARFSVHEIGAHAEDCVSDCRVLGCGYVCDGFADEPCPIRLAEIHHGGDSWRYNFGHRFDARECAVYFEYMYYFGGERCFAAFDFPPSRTVHNVYTYPHLFQ